MLVHQLAWKAFRLLRCRQRSALTTYPKKHRIVGSEYGLVSPTLWGRTTGKLVANQQCRIMTQIGRIGPKIGVKLQLWHIVAPRRATYASLSH